MREYVYYPGSFQPLALLTKEAGRKESWHYHCDPNGAPVRLTSLQGEIVWSEKTGVWGEKGEVYADRISNPLRFQGQYFDAETGLHYNRHRYYDPEIAGFISQDPIGLAGGLNVYQYAPNPLGYIDPKGLTPKTLYHYTTEEGMNGIMESGTIRASSGDIHARFGEGQYFTDITPAMIGGRTLKDASGTGKMSLGQLASNIYGDSRKLNGITHFVEIDVTGLNVTEPRKNTFRVANTGELNVSDRIVSSGKSTSCG